MSTDYKASVIIPVYNAEKTIRRCVESLALSEERSIRIILADDCSSDSSFAICKELEEEFEQVLALKNEKNSGVSYTRNAGLEHIQGEYVMFVDSDDFVSGEFTRKMLLAAEENKDSLVICGFKYVDNYYHGSSYIYDESLPSDLITIGADSFFDLHKKSLLQSLCNKVFRRDIIEKNNIRFDTAQSMGEDFQFVLEYLRAGNITSCTVLNEPLYYYLNNASYSLMSKFGTTNIENGFLRLELLLKIAGDDNPKQREQYAKAVEAMHNTNAYFMARAKKNKSDVIAYLEKYLDSDNARKICNNAYSVAAKERILLLISTIKSIPVRAIAKLKRGLRAIKIKLLTKKLRVKDFSIISQNCIGAVFYHDAGLPFLTPTVNLFIRKPDFIIFVKNLKAYLNSELEMQWGETYPIGILGGDITIDFMHYDNCKQAKHDWLRRSKRVNFDKLIILATDRNGFNDELFEEWKAIEYPKVLFTISEKYAEDESSVYYPEYKRLGYIGDIIPDRKFYRKNKLIDTVNSIESGNK